MDQEEEAFTSCTPISIPAPNNFQNAYFIIFFKWLQDYLYWNFFETHFLEFIKYILEYVFYNMMKFLECMKYIFSTSFL